MSMPAVAADDLVVLAREEWLGQDDDPGLWALAMMACEDPMADCGRRGRCEYDGNCFRLPPGAKRLKGGPRSAQAVFHRYVDALEEAYRVIRATQRSGVAGHLPGLVEDLERSRALIERVLGRKPERW